MAAPTIFLDEPFTLSCGGALPLHYFFGEKQWEELPHQMH
jgi:hypothetical protein